MQGLWRWKLLNAIDLDEIDYRGSLFEIENFSIVLLSVLQT